MIEKILNHEQEAINRLIEQYKNKPNFLSLIKIYARQVQELESVFFQIINSIALTEIVDLLTEDELLLLTEGGDEIVFDSGPAIGGDLLDRIGDLIDVSRNGLSDDNYYQKILNKIDIINSVGRVDDIIKVIGRAAGSIKTLYTEVYPASFFVRVFEPTYYLSKEEIDVIAKKVAPVGVGFTVIEVPDTPFVFDGDDEGEGFSSTGSPTTGGTFSEKISKDY